MVSIDDLRDCIDVLQLAIDGVSEAQLGKASPCAGWTVRDVINHVTGGGHLFAASAAGQTVPDLDGPLPDFLGSDPSGAFAAAAASAIVAFDAPGAMDRNVTLPFGAVPAPVALAIAFGDLLVHAWDVSVGAGNPVAIPDDLATKALGFYHQAINDDLRASGAFGRPVAVASSAPVVDQLVAFAGRTPR